MVSAELGPGNKGENYTLRRQREVERGGAARSSLPPASLSSSTSLTNATNSVPGCYPS